MRIFVRVSRRATGAGFGFCTVSMRGGGGIQLLHGGLGWILPPLSSSLVIFNGYIQPLIVALAYTVTVWGQYPRFRR